MYVLWMQGLKACPWDGADPWEVLQHHYSQLPVPLQLSKPFEIRVLHSFVIPSAGQLRMCVICPRANWDPHFTKWVNVPQFRHSSFLGGFFCTWWCTKKQESSAVVPHWKTQAAKRVKHSKGIPFWASMQRQASAHIPGAFLGSSEWGKSERTTGEVPSFTPEIRFVWHPQRGSGFGQIYSSNITFVGWEMNLEVLFCQNHIFKCCKLVSHSSLQHLWAAWTYTLFKISLTLSFVVQVPPDKINNPTLKDFPCFTWERKSSKSLAPSLWWALGQFYSWHFS